MTEPTPGSPWLMRAFHEIQRHRHLVLYGNIVDRVRWDHQYRPFPTTVNEFLSVAGFPTILRFNLVEGLTYYDDASRAVAAPLLVAPDAAGRRSDVPSERVRAPASGGTDTNGRDSARHTYNSESRERLGQMIQTAGRAEPQSAADVLALAHRLLSQTESATAIVLDSADLLIGPPAQGSPDYLTHAAHLRRLLTGGELAHARGDGRRLRNTIVLVVHELAALPGWLYQTNPHVATVLADRPRQDERASFIASELDSYYGGTALTVDERKHAIGALANLTDGMAVVDLGALGATSRVARITPRDARTLVARHRFGLREDPWEQLDLDKVSRATALLGERVIGQPVAIRAVTDVLVNARVGLDFVADTGHASTRPKGVLFFVGPTGVGKTELAKALAEFVFDDETALRRFDMSEFSQEHASERLTGAPPGFVGHEQGGTLTNWMLERPFSVVLFDEIEKANDKVWDKFLQIIDDGRLTDGQGRTAHFSHSVVIFTSNVGSRELPRPDPGGAPDYQFLDNHFTAAARRYFTERLGRPELLGRLGGGIVTFDILRPEVIAEIAAKFLNQLAAQAARRGYTVTFDRRALNNALIDHVMNDGIELGARQIRSPLLEQWVRVPLNRWIAANSPPPGTRIAVEGVNGTAPFTVRKVS